MVIKSILSKDTLTNTISYLEGCLILVDKPLTWTSFDVVNKIRFAIKHQYGVKKCKVGHAGTLDPLASGLLLVCTGPYTKQIDLLQSQSKVYSGLIQLGAVTATYDAESTPEKQLPVPDLDKTLLNKTRDYFTGELQQVPPVFSAIKVEGKKSYQLARRGEEVAMKPRAIHIFSLDLEIKSNHVLGFRVHCSKGTYIRSLAHDIGQFLKCGAYLLALRREAIGDYEVDQSLTIEEVISHVRQNSIEATQT